MGAKVHGAMGTNDYGTVGQITNIPLPLAFLINPLLPIFDGWQSI